MLMLSVLLVVFYSSTFKAYHHGASRTALRQLASNTLERIALELKRPVPGGPGMPALQGPDVDAGPEPEVDFYASPYDKVNPNPGPVVGAFNLDAPSPTYIDIALHFDASRHELLENLYDVTTSPPTYGTLLRLVAGTIYDGSDYVYLSDVNFAQDAQHQFTIEIKTAAEVRGADGKYVHESFDFYGNAAVPYYAFYR
jgi:hypothetical protein